MVTEGQRIEKKGRARKKEVFAQLVEAAQRLVAAAQRLVAAAMACKEQSNQRLRRFTSEIELLIDTWKD
jgi:hypothetical protein